MHELKQVAGKTGKRARAFCNVARRRALGEVAASPWLKLNESGGPAPSGQGAEVYFIDLKDGATVPAKLKLFFGLRNCGCRACRLGSREFRSPSPLDRHRAAPTR